MTTNHPMRPIDNDEDDHDQQYEYQDEADLGLVTIPSHAGIADDGSWKFSWKKLWAFTGPGWLMSIAYLDPGNLESDLQAGAIAGYKLIWVLFWATFLGFVLQVYAARLGVITGKNLAQICREKYSKPVSLALWIMTELAIIGSDIQEVVGSAIALQILFGIPLWGGVLITAFDSFTFLFLNFFGVRKLEAFFGVLILTMVVCFAWEFAIGGPDFGSIMGGLIIPRVPKSAVSQAVGMVGAVIMPHNIFLHSALVHSRHVDRHQEDKVKEANFYFSLEAGISLFVSFIINLLIVAVFAEGFYINNTPREDIGLFEAGTNLRERYGRVAEIVWAVGLLAAGQSSTMTGTFAGQFVMQGFLDLHVPKWVRTMVTRAVAIVPTIFVAVTLTSKLDTLDQLLNILQSIQLPFALIPLLAFISTPEVVGDFALSVKGRIGLGLCILAIVGINVYLVIVSIIDFPSLRWYGYTFIAIVSVAYLTFVAYLSYDSIKMIKRFSYERIK